MSDTENLQDPTRPIVEGHKIGKDLYDIMMTDMHRFDDRGILRPERYEKMGLTENPELVRSIEHNYSEEIRYISSENKQINGENPGSNNLSYYSDEFIKPHSKLPNREQFVADHAASLPKGGWFKKEGPSEEDTKETLMGTINSARGILNAALERQSRATIDRESYQASKDIDDAKGMLRRVYETGVTEVTAKQYVEADLDALKNIRAGLLLGEMGQRSQGKQQGMVK